MPQFILDTSGEVHGAGRWDSAGIQWQQLDAFTQGYIKCLFFTWPEDEGDDDEESEFVGGITSPDYSDLAGSALATIMDDCAKFQADNAALLAEAYARDYSEERAGHDFWLTRNGHGAGYWDRDELECDSDEYGRLAAKITAINAMWQAHGSASDATNTQGVKFADMWQAAVDARNALNDSSIGRRLTAACEGWPTLDAYLGDDGKAYV